MASYGCDAVLIAASEEDFEYWYPFLVENVRQARDVGLRVHLNFWAFGGVFGGEPASFFLAAHHDMRQITAESQEPVPAACINQTEFRNYLFERMERILRDAPVDGVFIDEPHFFPVLDMSEFTCVCETCQNKYETEMGTQMPMTYSGEVRAFREKSMHDFLRSMCSKVKSVRRGIEVGVCVIPAEIELLGTPDWDTIASIPELDVFSTDPYYHAFGKARTWALDAAKRTVATAREHKKKSQLWLQMFRIADGEERAVASLVPEYAKAGADSIFGWSYLANKGTVISCDKPDLLWKLVLDEYSKLRRKARRS
jgi:hypothetical protein